MNGIRSVPQVFTNGKYLGDATKIKSMFDSGELEEYFKKERVLQ
jgi:glutaredoxin-related protein